MGKPVPLDSPNSRWQQNMAGWSIVSGSLVVVHDGSWIKKVRPKACSMALIMKCLITNQEITCVWVELSNSADNYRAKLLSALCCSLILKAASMTPAVYRRTSLHWHCDNMGVVKHGNNLYPMLKDKQSQSYIIRLFQCIKKSLPFPHSYAWVQSHTDDKKKRMRVKTEKMRLNDRCDALCKICLVDGLMSRMFISSNFLFETIQIKAGGKKLTGPLRPFIKNHHGTRISRQVFGHGEHFKKLIYEDNFDLIYWKIIPKALKGFSSTFHNWLSKHVTGCCW